MGRIINERENGWKERKGQVGEMRRYKRKHDREGRKKGLEKDRKGKMLGMKTLIA